jgi:hypothetical protein
MQRRLAQKENRVRSLDGRWLISYFLSDGKPSSLADEGRGVQDPEFGARVRCFTDPGRPEFAAAPGEDHTSSPYKKPGSTSGRGALGAS